VPDEKLTVWTVAIDKYDKVGIEGVKIELEKNGFNESVVSGVETLSEINSSANSFDILSKLSEFIKGNEKGELGLKEMELLLNRAKNNGIVAPAIKFDVMLARGLDYYTGAIFEVKVADSPVGSICGGGRYDNLTGIFGLEGMSGVGISFGADRIEDVLEYFNKFPEKIDKTTDVLVTQMDPANCSEELKLVSQIRTSGYSAELYPDASKLKKQIKYANDINIPYVVFIGEDERNSGKVTLKKMSDGTQMTILPEEVVKNI
jgi:histidyl-tRNA synthetase